MKVLRIVVLVVVALVALLAIAVGIALIPAVQTWAVKKVVAGQPGMKLDVSRVAAGFSSAELNDVRLVKDGLVITAKRVNARYSALDYLTRKRLTVDDLAVDDLLIDARAAGATPASSASAANPTPSDAKPNRTTPPEPFHGFLSQPLPVDLQIGRVSVPGRALLPNDQTATFELHGGDIAAGRKGTIDWKVDIATTQATAPFRTLHASGTAVVHVTTEQRIDSLDLNATASAEGPNLPSDQIKLEARIEQPTAGGNEGYNANVSLVRGSAVDQLATLAGQFDTTSSQISGAWKITIRSEQVGALLTGLGLPDAAINGSGTFTLKPDTGAMTAKGEVDSAIARLEKISPALAPVGRLHVVTRFDGGLADNVAQLSQFNLDATAANGRKLAEITALQKIGFSLATKKVSLADTKADLARIHLQNLPLAWAQPFAAPLTIDSGDVSMVLSVAAEADGSRVRITSSEPLSIRNVTLRNGEAKLVDQLTLTAKPQAEYTQDKVHAELNDLNLSTPAGDRITGRTVADITELASATNRSIAFRSEITATLVAALKPYLPIDTGPLTVTHALSGVLTGTNLKLTQATTTSKRPTGALILSSELVQPVSIDLATKALTIAKPDAEFARIRCGEIPLAWAEPYVANSKLSGQISGGTLAVTLRSLDDLTANTTQPVTIRGATVAMNGQPMLQNVDAVLDLTATKHGTDVAFNVRDLEAKQGATSLAKLVVTGTAKLGEKVALTAKGTLEADAAALSQQPAAASANALASGRISATFDATVTETIQAKARVAARQLVARDGNRPLGDAELNVTATVQGDGSSAINVPFTLTNADRKSDVLLDGKLTRGPAGIAFNGHITSEHLFVDDLKPLAALAPSTPDASTGKTAPSPNGPRATVDTQPFWTGAAGKVDVDLKEIRYGKDYTVSGVRGSASASDTRVALESLEGRINNEPFKVDATVDFAKGQPKPYTLAATANVPNFDAGAFLRAQNPNEPPMVETKVTITSKLDGKGGTLMDLLKNSYGVFDVSGSQGVLRLLSGTKAKVAAGASMLGMLGGAVANSDRTVAVSQLTQKLTNLPFDKVTVHVERGADLNLKVSGIEFLSPDTRVTGSGGLANQPDVAIQNQPMQFTFQLAGKEGMAVLLDSLKLLNGQKDEQGYYLINRTFTIKGTPSNPDRSDLTKLLEEIATRTVLPAAADALQRLLGK